MPDQSDQTGIVVSILGFYLSLVSLLGSFFYVHLANWFDDIKRTEQKWDLAKDRAESYTQQVECYAESRTQRSPTPLIGFGLLTGFMLVLSAAAVLLHNRLPDGSNIGWYLYGPGGLFLVAFVVVSAVYLRQGRKKAKRVNEEATARLWPDAS